MTAANAEALRRKMILVTLKDWNSLVRRQRWNTSFGLKSGPDAAVQAWVCFICLQDCLLSEDERLSLRGERFAF